MKIKKSPTIGLFVAIIIALFIVASVETFKNVVEIDPTQILLLFLLAILILFIFSNLVLTGAES